jgi:hypothetical protein
VGFTEEEIGVLLAAAPDFHPGTEGDQGKLDELAPKMVKCPTCNHVFNSRGHEQD